MHDDQPTGLACDLYELTMAASYLAQGMGATATFSLYVRDLPAERGYLVAAGVDDAVDAIRALRFTDDDMAYLRQIGFDSDAADRLGALTFTGDVWAVPEGRTMAAGEPLLEVTAPIAEAQLVETIALNRVTFRTALASKAARVRVAAAGRVDLVDFAFRRAHGVEAAEAFARVSAIVGFAGTSNVAAARRLGLRPVGTMAHSYIEAFPSEREAFAAFAHDFPDRATFLVDTYDTLGGVARAVEVVRELGLAGDVVGVRLDSGDLGALAVEARRLLDGAGLPEARIYVSGGVDEHALDALLRSGVPIDAAGIGTRVGVSADAPYLDSVYKLVSYAGRPVRKLSPGKATTPGAKQVWRWGDGRPDVVALRDEERPGGAEPLLRPVVVAGKRVEPAATIAEARGRFEADLAALPPAALLLVAPEPLRAELSPAVQDLTTRSTPS